VTVLCFVGFVVSNLSIRALRIFGQPEHYARLRENARKSVLDNSVVADAWAREFCRLLSRLGGRTPATPAIEQKKE
jgi:hypothetical protein